MLFSVCIPVYNTSKYLEECLESVLSQTEKDYEIVLIDDGSTDDCPQICDRYAGNYPNIRVIHKENEGLMMTRRRGFREAKGDYFICLDSDDYLCNIDALHKIRVMIENENCDLVLYNYIAGKENPMDDQKITLFDYPDGYVFDESTKIELYKKLIIGKGLNAIWIKAASKNIVDVDVDYSVWKSDICRGEDRFQSYPMLTNAKKVGYVKEPLIHYRWTPGSISNNPKLKYYQAFRCIYYREEAYLEKWNIAEDVKKGARLKRIPNILQIIANGYHTSKRKGSVSEWENFVTEISNDLFFHELFPKEYKKSINLYYRLQGWLIRNRHIKGLKCVLEAYQWYSVNIKKK